MTPKMEVVTHVWVVLCRHKLARMLSKIIQFNTQRRKDNVQETARDIKLVFMLLYGHAFGEWNKMQLESNWDQSISRLGKQWMDCGCYGDIFLHKMHHWDHKSQPVAIVSKRHTTWYFSIVKTNVVFT